MDDGGGGSGSGWLVGGKNEIIINYFRVALLITYKL